MDRKLFGIKGETGIGTLIIFISVVLVAAIAANVLLGTAGSLQQRSLTTGKQTEREVSGGIKVVSVSGADGTDSGLDNFEYLILLSAGSDPMALDELIVTFDTKNTSQVLEYTSGNLSTAYYNVSYVKNGSEHMDGYLTRGDVVILEFNSTRSISESEVVVSRIVPKHGIVVPVNFVTPDVIVTQRVLLYP